MMTYRRLYVLLLVFGACLVAPSLPALAQSQVPFGRLVSKLHWRSVGPARGGRVVAVSGVVQQPNVFYMGAVDGGIWKSTDYGVTWNNISDKTLHSESISIGSIAVAPSNPNIIYAGTGESDIRQDFITGDGMYKSTDAGKTWQAIGLKDTRIISDIVVDPQNPEVVYVASLGRVSRGRAFVPNNEGGVYKTTDGGQTWKKVLFVDNKTGAIDIAMDPQDPQVLYAAMWQVYRTPWKLDSGGPGSGLYKSTDGGTHWTNISRNPGMPQGIFARSGVAVAPSQPNTVYAVIQAKHGGLFRSNDAGRHWKRVNRSWELRQRGFYYSTVYVDPKNPNTIYMPQVAALWVSHDGGKSISKLHTPHGDNHVLWINPDNPQIMLEGNDGGATVTTNAGKTWTGEHDQPTGQFYHVNVDNQFPFHIYGAQQDEGAIEAPSSMPGGEIPYSAWKTVAGGEGVWVVPQPGKPWITYGSGGGGEYEAFFRDNRRTDFTQQISPWPDFHYTGDAEMMKYRFAWTHPIVFAPTDPHELLVGANVVLKSMNYGQTWSAISPDLTRNVKSTEGPSGGPVMWDQTGAEIYPYISGLAVSPLDKNVIWAGSSGGLVHITTDGGQHWVNITPPQFKAKWGWIRSIAASYTAKCAAYLTVSRRRWGDFRPYVYKTTDCGKHWTSITQGLPHDAYIMSVAIDPHNKNLVFLGGDTVYVSLDGGSHWEPLSLNLPRAQVRGIAIQAQQNSVVVATHGRGFWVLDNLALLEQLADGVHVASDQTHLFTPQLTWMTKSYGGRRFGRPSPTVGENHPFGTIVFFHLPANYNGATPVTLEFTTASGKVVHRYTLHPKTNSQKDEKKTTIVAAGMNRFKWDLRYPGGAAIQHGYYAPSGTTHGYDPDHPGPEIVPGTYYVVLKYGDQSQRAQLEVKLDPRLTTTQADMEARQKLQFNILATLNTLAAAVNRALALQSQLEQVIHTKPQKRSHAQALLSNLKQATGVLVQTHFHHSGEGDSQANPALRAGLASLYMNLGDVYAGPRKVDYQVYDSLKTQMEAGISKLNAVERSTRDTFKH